MDKIINALKTFVFGEEEEKQPKGRVYIGREATKRQSVHSNTIKQSEIRSRFDSP